MIIRMKLSGLGLLLMFIAAGSAVYAFDEAKGEPPFDVHQWLNGPDRRDIPMDVTASYKCRTLERRCLVEMKARIQYDPLRKEAQKQNLHFVLKAAAGDHRWISGGIYHALSDREAMANAGQTVISANLYLRPGRYTVAIILYDALSKKGSIARKRVTIPDLKPEPLPELDLNIPDVEFDSGPPQFVSTWLSDTVRGLPVNNQRPLCIDILANISDNEFNYSDRNFYGTSDIFKRRIHSPRQSVLQLTSLLSRMKLRNGRLRVSIWDASRMQSFYDRQEAAAFNWKHAFEAITKQDRETVEAGLLRSQTPATFLVGMINSILEDRACAPEMEDALKIIIIISREVRLPKVAAVQPIPTMNPESARAYYFYVGDYADDDLPRVLNQANLRKISDFWSNSRSIRSALASFISTLENLN